VTNQWTEQPLNYIIDLARLSAVEADAVTGLLLPKFVAQLGLDLATFRAIVAAMDPGRG
jgi:hypothetical protein